MSIDRLLLTSSLAVDRYTLYPNQVSNKRASDFNPDFLESENEV